jgi:hypothetical protein
MRHHASPPGPERAATSPPAGVSAAPPAAAEILRLQRTAGNRATASLLSSAGRVRRLQRLLEPAIVNREAGLHKFEAVTGGHTVRSGGAFGKGISGDKLQPETMVLVDRRRSTPTHVWAKLNGREGYLKLAHLRLAERIGGSTFYAVPVRQGMFQIYDGEAGKFLTVERPENLRANYVQSLAHVLKAESAAKLDVAAKAKLVEKLDKQTMLGVPPKPEVWQLAAGNVAKVKQRVEQDHERLVAAKLITRLHALKNVEFTGADFHKGGQAPFFLTFEHLSDPNATRKLVYKPGDLRVDRALFGRSSAADDEPSAAESLDPAGGSISQYTIVPMDDPARGEHYGYMEFVDTSAGPSTAADVKSVYLSIAANAALSFLIGLEDVHYENVLLLKDRVQIIDMEATTGLFKKKAKPQEGGFLEQVWLGSRGAINGKDGIDKQLARLVEAGTLTGAPPTAGLGDDMRTQFIAVLKTAAGGAFDQPFADAKSSLSSLKSRIVPIPTEGFYRLLQLAEGKTFAEWCAEIDGAGSKILAKAQEFASDQPPDFLKRLLKSPGTHKALVRGEIPYYNRELSGDRVEDEDGNVIDATGFTKIGKPIGQEMQKRRGELQTEGFGDAGGDAAPAPDPLHSSVVGIFDAQIVPAIETLNESLRGQLAAKGHAGPQP